MVRNVLKSPRYTRLPPTAARPSGRTSPVVFTYEVSETLRMYPSAVLLTYTRSPWLVSTATLATPPGPGSAVTRVDVWQMPLGFATSLNSLV